MIFEGIFEGIFEDTYQKNIEKIKFAKKINSHF